ncbi:Protein of unknown function [Propionibacterium freudenreichii]|nr:Protein of unknown function [Propionibacterium freudenreichii subsp. freudenreichii]CEG93998.1 Protein of unknown function [Propionibacterium freudenreichii]CEG98308.1 Protein of unknown function [Propionibacterium freudenreichii]CEH03228.1 Protein of unknown function [Propionibacterium freudenreichii]CEH03341.1 Protein of unknown function [Propionibacterium freudenreichii]
MSRRGEATGTSMPLNS